MKLLERRPGELPEPVDHPKPLVAATRHVLEAIRVAAKENRQAAGDATLAVTDTGPLRGDRLTEHLFRRAAAAARELDPKVAARAYVLALGLGIDDSGILRKTPVLSQLALAAESDDERRARLSVLGSPTVLGRRDLAQHFVLSGVLAALAGRETAETLGIVKEMRDARGGTGFSFADLAADLAGASFAEALGDGRLAVVALENDFRVADFMPPIDGLPEGLSWQTFQDRFGSAEDDRFHQVQASLRHRIANLPGYTGR